MPEPSAEAWGYRPGLDGLRTLAIYLVLLFHAGLGHVRNGYLGVDVFFVLSGFLVTNVMMSEHRETGRLRLGRFYARRIRRLLPAAAATIPPQSPALQHPIAIIPSPFAAKLAPKK